jgi:hypothetical protein
MKNMLILMWVTTIGLWIIVENNNRAAIAHSLYGDLGIAKAILEVNYAFSASLAVLGITTIAATGLALRRFLA